MNTKLTTSEMGRMNIEQYKQSDKLPLVVVLDNVRSQHNVGAVFRTGDAMRIERVVLCGICCCPPNPEIHKTALGAEESVTWQYFPETIDAVLSQSRLSLTSARPVFFVADTFNRIVWYSQGYTIGLGEQLLGAARKL